MATFTLEYLLPYGYLQTLLTLMDFIFIFIFCRKQFAMVPNEDGLVPVPHDLPHFPHKVSLVPFLYFSQAILFIAFR